MRRSGRFVKGLTISLEGADNTTLRTTRATIDFGHPFPKSIAARVAHKKSHPRITSCFSPSMTNATPNPLRRLKFCLSGGGSVFVDNESMRTEIMRGVMARKMETIVAMWPCIYMYVL